jgi:hypothetical protein
MSHFDVHFFFTLRDQIKLYHWQTTSFARHKATDDAIKALDERIDAYVETYAGKYGRPKLTSRSNRIELSNLTEKTILPFLRKCIHILTNNLVSKLSPTDTDLISIRDDMLAELNKLLYLFTLQ